VETLVVIHLMMMTRKDIAHRMVADDDAHAAMDPAMAVAAMETQTQDHTMVEALEEAVEITVVTAVVAEEVTLEEQECGMPARVMPSPSPPSTI